MADNDQLLEQIRKVVREENEPINKRLDAQGSSIEQIKTIVEATAAGQQELQETVATRADIQDLKATLTKKVKDNTERIEELEKIEGIPHPHKH